MNFCCSDDEDGNFEVFFRALRYRMLRHPLTMVDASSGSEKAPFAGRMVVIDCLPSLLSSSQHVDELASFFNQYSNALPIGTCVVIVVTTTADGAENLASALRRNRSDIDNEALVGVGEEIPQYHKGQRSEAWRGRQMNQNNTSVDVLVASFLRQLRSAEVLTVRPLAPSFLEKAAVSHRET